LQKGVKYNVLGGLNMFLSEPYLEVLAEKCGSDFTAAVVAAKRARQLNEEEAQKLLDKYEGKRLVSMACEEIAAGKIKPSRKN
jgi:DNA-directed RNA polymerase subunit omega